MKSMSPWLVFAVTMMTACTPRAAQDHGEAAGGRTPEAIFAELEDRLLNASVISGRFTVSAEGAFSAALDGSLAVSRGGETDLDATGTFGGAGVTLFLRSDGLIMEGGNGDRTFREASPAGLTKALVLGLTRMGILHNLARLTGGVAPDRADGEVREWVEVRRVQFAPAAGREGLGSGLTALSFVIHVSGERVAEATLWLDPASGLPVRREQVVAFPGGSMTVTESYDLTLDGW